MEPKTQEYRPNRKNQMKRLPIVRYFLPLLLALAVLLSLTACGDDDYYKPIKSSRRERTVLATVGDHEVKYELVRFLFMSRIDELDGGDRSRWEGEEADTLWAAAMEKILPEICEIYAVFDVCTAWGIDPEGDNIDEVVNEYVKADIDGGEVSGQTVAGFGSVKAYKAALAESYCTDAVRRLLYRYSACMASLYSYIAVNRAQGTLSVTDEELTTFLLGDDCAHVNRVFIPYVSQLGNTDEERKANAYARIRSIRADMLLARDYDTLIQKAFRYSYATVTTLATDDQIDNGIWFGRYSTDADYSSVLYDTIFSIASGEVSDIIETEDGYYVLYGMARDAASLTQSTTLETVTELYFEELYNRQIADVAASLVGQVTYTTAFQKLNAVALMEGK
jgi:hypothetical protein